MSETQTPTSRKRRTSMKKQEQAPTTEVAVEQRNGKRFGVLTLLAAAVSFATVIAQLSALDPNTKGKAQELKNYDPDLAVIATSLKVLSLVMLIGVGHFLFHAIRRREPSAPNYVLYLGIGACLLLAVVSVTGTLAFNSVVNTFNDLSAQTNATAEEVYDDNAIMRIRPVVEIGSAVLFGGWLAVICAGAIGVGLMPRFLGYFGYGVAAMQIIAGVAGSALLVGWIAAVGLLMVDKWPGGRPKAWETGRAEPLTW